MPKIVIKPRTTATVAPAPPEPVEKEAPIGGGKPFRKLQGQVYVIDGDEFVTEDNPVGDEKIDTFGNLLGGTRLIKISMLKHRVKTELRPSIQSRYVYSSQ